MVEFSHIQNERAQMVDISAKNDVIREAAGCRKNFLKTRDNGCDPARNCRER